jgi:hypothetical protein
MLLLANTSITVLAQITKDQTQENIGEIDWLQGGEWQEFIPTIKKLVRVELYVGCYHAGSNPIIVSIEKPLGNVLSSKTLIASDLPLNSDDWVSFDNLNVTLQNGQTYYIVIKFLPGSEYAWSGAWGNPYTSGVSSKDPDWDYCFRTFADKSKTRDIVNSKLSIFLENHPNMFPLLRLILEI